MGEVSTETVLTNPMDQAMAREGHKEPEEVRQTKPEEI